MSPVTPTRVTEEFAMGLHPQSLRIPGLSIALCTACLGVGLMAQPVTDCNSNGIADAIDLSPSIAVREARSVSLASGPHSAALGDVDQDGILELFVVNVDSDDLVILRGSIDGSFDESRHYALNDGPVAVAVSHLDGDQRLDVVVTSSVPAVDNVTVFFGGVNGSLEYRVELSAGESPYDVVVADWNGDGILDLTTADRGGGTVSVFLGAGHRTFQESTRYPAGATPESLAVADLDGDGWLDLAATSDFSNEIVILRGNGDGTFLDPRSLPATEAPSDLVAADFDGDGVVDLASANPGSGDVSLFVGRGDATYEEPQRYAVGSRPFALVAADLDHNGLPDLAVTDIAGAEVRVLLQGASGGFHLPEPFAVGQEPTGIVAADLDLDGTIDLAVTNEDSDTVSILLNRVVPPNSADCNSNSVPDECDVEAGTAQDCNQDGIPDECELNRFRLESPEPFPGLSPIESLVSADINGDGRMDLVTANPDREDVLIWTQLESAILHPSVLSEQGSVSDVLAADLDNDGALDIAGINFRGNRLQVFFNDGAGTFQPPLGIETAEDPTAVVAADLERDGDLDLIVVIRNSCSCITVFLNDGDRSFSPGGEFLTGPNPWDAAAVDLDGDDLPDLAVSHYNGHEVAVLRNLGPGGSGDWLGFAEREPYRLEAHHTAIVADDFDGDSIPDLAVVHELPHGVSLLINAGSGDFGPASTFPTLPSPLSLAAADLDLDGTVDLVLTERKSTRTSVFLNDGHGLLTRAWTQELETGSSVVTTADLDGDGVVDIAAAMAGISVIRNATRNDANLNGRPDDCDVPFVRGDCDGDGLVSGTVNDAVFLLRYLFIGGDTPPCLAACDSNADGVILGAVTDAVYLLRFSFLGSAPPAWPFPGCGVGTRGDAELGCETPPPDCSPQEEP